MPIHLAGLARLLRSDSAWRVLPGQVCLPPAVLTIAAVPLSVGKAFATRRKIA